MIWTGDYVVKNDDLKLAKNFDDITFVKGEQKPQGQQRTVPIVFSNKALRNFAWLTWSDLQVTDLLKKKYFFNISIVYSVTLCLDIEDLQKPTTQRLHGFFAYLKDQLERLDVKLESLDVK